MPWPTAKLSEICIFDRGLTYTKSDEVNFDGTPVLRANNIDLAKARLDLSDIRYISTNVVVPNSKRTKQGGLLICTASGSKAHLGKIAYIDDAIGWAFGGFMGQITAKPSVDSRYLYYILISEAFRIHLEKRSDGVNINNLKFSDIGDFAVPLPSLTEQQRIAAILDEAFAGIAKATANAARNLANARELLAKLRLERFNILLNDWPMTSLGEVCEFENGDRGANYPGKQHRVSQGIPFINAGHLTETGIDFSDMDYITPERFNLLGHGKINPKDVLFCLRGSIGKFACVEDLNNGAIASSLVILRTKKAIDLSYLLEYLAGPICAKMIEKYKGGAAQPNLGARDLMKFEIPLPPKEVQKAKAEELALFAAHTRDLEAAYSEKIACCRELRTALLSKAFAGQLTGKDAIAA